MYPPNGEQAPQSIAKIQILLELEIPSNNFSYKVIGSQNPIVILGMLSMAQVFLGAEYSQKANHNKSSIMQLPPGTRLG